VATHIEKSEDPFNIGAATLINKTKHPFHIVIAAPFQKQQLIDSLKDIYLDIVKMFG
jgi:hypothetical protein